MNTDLRRVFVTLVKRACEKYLEADDAATLGWNYDFEIESIRLLPVSESEAVDHTTVICDEDGSLREVQKELHPFAFRLRYWNEFGDEVNEPCHPEKTLGLVEVVSEVGKLIAGQVDFTKAVNVMHVLRGDE